MIITDDKKQPSGPEVHGQSSHPQPNPTESTSLLASSPPPYSLPPNPHTSSSRTSSLHSSMNGNSLGLPSGSGKPPPPRRSPFRRFCIALSAAVAIIILIDAIWAIPSIVKQIRKGNTAGGNGRKGNGGYSAPTIEIGEGEKVGIVAPEEGTQIEWDRSWGLDDTLLSKERNITSCVPFLLYHSTFPPFPSSPATISSASSDSTLTNHYYSIATTYIIPSPPSSTPSEEILTFLHARGYTTSGTVRILSHEDADETELGGASDLAKDIKDGEVRVTIRGWSRVASAWDDLHVCRAGEGGSQGVVILREAPPHRIDLDSSFIHLDIFLRFPKSNAASSSLGIHGNKGGLEILTSNFAVGLGKVGAGFGEVDVRTTNAGVRGDSLVATKASISTTNGEIVCADCCPSKPSSRAESFELHTTNAKISGQFCAQDYIAGSTTSGRIEGKYDARTVSMKTTNGAVEGAFTGIVPGYKKAGWKDSSSTGLMVTTTNGRIDASFAIEKPTKDYDSTTKVPVSFVSTNNAVHVTALDVPKQVATDVLITSTNGRIEYQGFPTFQGDVLLSTSSYQKLDLSIGPSKDHSERYLKTVIKTNGALQGSVIRHGEKEGDDRSVWSRLNVHTTNAPIYVIV